MSHVITAVYEHGVLHPLTPLGLHEHQRVQVRIIPEEVHDTIEDVLEWLIRTGKVSPPRQAEDPVPCSEDERAPLARALGNVSSKPLSASILDERGAW